MIENQFQNEDAIDFVALDIFKKIFELGLVKNKSLLIALGHSHSPDISGKADVLPSEIFSSMIRQGFHNCRKLRPTLVNPVGNHYSKSRSH